ncbi:hypothetical protein GCK72_021926 [Caenorhabditis remanei]|uniref:Uncharacterized protein n=1 Tax=Caenorhabditis remanei TaxID=31234 RepID=A0A6A5GJB4_CAERE|nr:hypothetical protein GCK72_021926 [Caenorhabditis remanei]KAF1755357.1 hypothetical protein GCK72_021926 [Caenorhabditis remanei]
MCTLAQILHELKTSMQKNDDAHIRNFKNLFEIKSVEMNNTNNTTTNNNNGAKRRFPVIGMAGMYGRDKRKICISPKVSDLGQQLLPVES